MGHYLSSPNKEKISEDGDYKNMRYAASSMQGIPSLLGPSLNLSN